MAEQYSDLPQESRDDVHAACQRYGFVPEDFEFVIDGSKGSIAVERVVGGQYKIYRTAGDTAWTASFAADLATDWFGHPLAD